MMSIINPTSNTATNTATAATAAATTLNDTLSSVEGPIMRPARQLSAPTTRVTPITQHDHSHDSSEPKHYLPHASSANIGGIRPADFHASSRAISSPTAPIYFDKTHPLKHYVVFDFDETLGYFAQINAFLQAVQITFKTSLSERQLFEVIDQFPEIFRPKIFTVIEYLKRKILSGHCDGVLLYTNNQGHKAWPEFITRYINYKANYPVFTKVIAAWKVGNIMVEKCRSTHNKTYDDLIKCGSLPEKSRIFFIDDRAHEDMIHDNVTYILAKPYYHRYRHDDMVAKFMKTTLAKSLVDKNETLDSVGAASAITAYLLRVKFDNDKSTQPAVDITSSDQLIRLLADFFSRSNHRRNSANKTKKKPRRKKERKSTRKHRKH